MQRIKDTARGDTIRCARAVVISQQMQPMTQQTVRARVFGIVQGVCFREYTRRKAEELGLAGWVRNRPDGSVEALISGPPDSVEQMILWLHHGSPYAHVDRVEIDSETVESLPLTPSFQINF
jgi:acylphosphatase